jgi:membrane protein implicated in regulation of membrane protease activity
VLVLLIGAILAAVFVLPRPWGIAVVAVAVAYELVEKAFWIRYSRRRPILMGKEAMIGANARVVSDCLPSGYVRFRGELWRARCSDRVVAGDRVRIGSVGADLTLEVSPTT